MSLAVSRDEDEPSRVFRKGLLPGSGLGHPGNNLLCDARVPIIGETGTAIAMTDVKIDRRSIQDGAHALRAALHKIQLAENVLDQILTGNVTAEQTERLRAIRSDLRAIQSLINARLQE